MIPLRTMRIMKNMTMSYIPIYISLTFDNLHFTFYVLRFTVYGLRFTLYILQFTVYG